MPVSSSPPEPSFPPEPPLNVLLVEDNDEDAEFLEIILSRVQDPPYHMERTQTLAETLKRLEQDPIDLVILDLSLPDSRGFNTFLSVLETVPRASIVVLTGFNDERLALRALHMGAQDYIVKGNLDTGQLSRSMRFAIERKRAAVALQESEERLRSVIENALDTIITLDQSGLILSFNPAGEKTFGYQAEEVVGQDIQKLFPDFPNPVQGGSVSQTFREWFSRSFGPLVEIRGKHKDGHSIPLELTLNETTQRGNPLIIIVGRDITERKQSEEKLRKAQDDLVHAAKMAVLGQMSAGISHELNQPLEALQAYVDNIRLLIRQKRFEEVDSNFEAISDMTRRAGKIIRNIKNLAHHHTQEIQPVSPQAALEAALSFLQMGSRLEGIDIVKLFPQEMVWILGEVVQLEQVFLNIMTNAVDAMEGSAVRRLVLAIHTNDDEVQVIIRDTGPGIEDNLLSRIFEPFFSTKDIKKGLGLGLAITSNIISDFGGTVTASNHPEGGAQFILTFPKVREAVTSN